MTQTRETIAHVTFYIDKKPAYVTTLTGPCLLKQAAAELAGPVTQLFSGKSVGFRGQHHPRFCRLHTDFGTEAHVTLLSFPKGCN